MPRKSDVPLERVTINLVAGDYGKLTELFPDVTAAVIIRKITHNFIAKIEAKRGVVPEVEIDLDLS